MKSERKGLLVVLVAAVIGVWGYNVYQLVAGVSPHQDETMKHAPVAAPAARPAETVSFTGSTRDPFAPPPANIGAPNQEGRIRDVGEPPEMAAPPPELVTFRLDGTVGNTAILRAADQRVHVVSAGDAIGEAVVARVGKDFVVLKIGGREITLRLAD